jgi:dihydroorotase-like cyclic amidohydrolase
MDYVLIKNGILAGETLPVKSDILICNNKIIDIGSNIGRPCLDTPVIDAGGKYILPGIIDINRNFYNLFCFDQHHLARLLQSQIISGTTFWMDSITADEIEKAGFQLKAEGFSMPDYSFHLLADSAFCHNPDKFLPLILTRGVSSIMIHWPMQENISDQQLKRVFQFAASNGLLIVFDLQNVHYESVSNKVFSDNIAEFHLDGLGMLARGIKESGCRACFLNVQFLEELQILKDLRADCDVYAELSLAVTLGSKESFIKYGCTDELSSATLNSIPADVLIAEVIANHWCLIGRSGISIFNEDVHPNAAAFNRPNDYFIFKYFLSVLSSIDSGAIAMKPFQMAQILASRPAGLFGLAPVKGSVKVGSDADIIIWDADYERNLYVSFSHQGASNMEYKLKGRTDFVFMKGKIIYNGEQILTDSLPGDYILRYM